MPTPVTVPKATISMEEANILQWLKTEGEQVLKEEVLFEMETDKAIIEVPSPADGVLLRVLIPQGSAKVEDVVGWIGQPGESIPQADSISLAKPVLVVAPPHGAAIAVESPRVMATPAARRRATELGVALSAVKGTGPGGRITQQDVEGDRALPAPPQERKALMQHVSASWSSVPHIHISREVDAAGLHQARQGNPGVSVTDLLLYVLSRLLPEYGGLTQVWKDDVLEPATQIHLGVAVDTPGGVITPIIRNAGSLTLKELSRQRRELSEAARARRLKLDQIQGGVFTLTNLGMHDVDFFAPIINLPQTAILAAGRIRQQPVVTGGGLGVGWRMWANLAVDHRVADGVYAARFLAQFQRKLDLLPGEIKTV